MKYHDDQRIGLFGSDSRLTVLQKLGDPLVKLAAHVDFEVFRGTLEKALYGSKDESVGGRPPFDPVLMFKALVLQSLYGLSDDALEFQINDRHSFMSFLGLHVGSRVPDAKTVWLFRERLQKAQLVETLFNEMNAQLAKNGVIANKGLIVDATFVEAPRQRNSRDENKEVKAGHVPKEWKKNRHRLCQKDTDARWTQKNHVNHFGYKNHVLCDGKSKMIKNFLVTDASVHDSAMIGDLVKGGDIDGQTLHADSAYRSGQIEEMLLGRNIRSRIHEKGYRNRPLTAKQKRANTAKSRVRARVEHIFGFMTQSMRGIAVRARSLKRNVAVIGLKNLTYNLCRMVQLGHSLEMMYG